jgi:hypothetical protein
LTQGKNLPWEYWRWKIAEQYHWTLDYVDGLSMQDIEDYFQVHDGIGKANSSILK